jgi:DNA-binding NarL/FixJ family response regulator
MSSRGTISRLDHKIPVGADHLLKGVEPPALIDAVRTVAGGEALLEPSATRRLIEAYAGGQPAASPAGFPLPGQVTILNSRSL